MFCSKCGTVNDDSAMFCSTCGCNLKSSNTNNMNQYQTYNQQNVINNPNDKLGIGMGILCFLIPIVGIVLYFVWRTQFPNKAKNSAIVSVIGFIINLIVFASS